MVGRGGGADLPWVTESDNGLDVPEVLLLQLIDGTADDGGTLAVAGQDDRSVPAVSVLPDLLDIVGHVGNGGLGGPLGKENVFDAGWVVDALNLHIAELVSELLGQHWPGGFSL